MPDITMCGFQCPKCESCYRFIATPSMRQTWFSEPPWSKHVAITKYKPFTQRSFRDGQIFKCEYYWEAEKKYRKRALIDLALTRENPCANI